MSEWRMVLLEPAKEILAQIGTFLTKFLLVIIILIIGWIISKLIKTVVVKALKAVKLDDLAVKIELNNLFEKGGIAYTLSELIGVICYWLAMLVTFMVAINAIGLTIAAELLNKVILYVPNVIAAIFILILGMFVATLLKNIVLASANNAGISQGKFLSQTVSIVITAFAIFVAMEQLKIGIAITEVTVAIVLGSVGLGLALAFGLGCKDIAAKFMSEQIEKMKSNKK